MEIQDFKITSLVSNTFLFIKKCEDKEKNRSQNGLNNELSEENWVRISLLKVTENLTMSPDLSGPQFLLKGREISPFSGPKPNVL